MILTIGAVPEAEVSDPEPWFIFNDFAVQNITEEEALSIPSGWKVSARLPPSTILVHMTSISGSGRLILGARRCGPTT